MKRALIAIASLLLLTGCPVTTPPKTITLFPSQMNWFYQHQVFVDPWCAIGLGGYGSGGLGLIPSADSNEVVSGFADIWNGGSGPGQCVQKSEYFYRGNVQFDVSQFDAILAATLKFDVADGQAPTCAATTLGMATGNDSWNFDAPLSLPAIPCVKPFSGPWYSFGVSSMVREWISNNRPNFGFILAGPRLDFPGNNQDLPEDNDANFSRYNNFQLEILYNPTFNPRAPQ